MGAMASQISSLMTVYSTVYSGADQRKHQSSASLAFVWGIHRWPVNSAQQMASNAENVSIWWRHYVFCFNVCLLNENFQWSQWQKLRQIRPLSFSCFASWDLCELWIFDCFMLLHYAKPISIMHCEFGIKHLDNETTPSIICTEWLHCHGILWNVYQLIWTLFMTTGTHKVKVH